MAYLGWLLLAFATGISGAVIGIVVAVLSGLSWGATLGAMYAGFFGLPIVVGVILAWLKHTDEKRPPEGDPER